MKITKQQLKQIIKEELQAVLSEDLRSDLEAKSAGSFKDYKGFEPSVDVSSEFERASREHSGATGGSGKTSIEYGKIGKEITPKVMDQLNIKDTDVVRYNSVPMQVKDLPPEGLRAHMKGELDAIEGDRRPGQK